MKIERINGKAERRILTGMIVDKSVLGRLATKWEPDLCSSKWAQIVGDLCVDYHKNYNDAPGKAIEGIFAEWASSGRAKDKETVSLVEKFLMGLSDEYEEQSDAANSSFLIDRAAKHFTKNKLKRLLTRIQGAIDTNDVDKASELVAEFHKVEMGAGAGINVLHDKEALLKAFEERAKPLIELPGAIGQFFGHNLCREGFVSFLAPEKRGKTWWLVWMAWKAICQRRKVAFFSVGDESQEEMMLRFSTLAARKPLRPCVVKIPTEIEKESNTSYSVKHDEVNFEEPLTAREAYRAFKAVAKMKIKSDHEFLRMSVHPNSTLTIRAIDAQLTEWERDGWVPDVVIVDYMDILRESTTQGSGDDARHRINQTWKDARGLSQKWHILLLTATQADSDAFKQDLLDKDNFSEDKRKLAHVTGMVGINQTADEGEDQVMRLNWIVRRGAYYNVRRVCYCAGALSVGNPAIRTAY